MGKKIITIIVCSVFFIVMQNHSYSARLNVYDNSNNGYYIVMGVLLIVGTLTLISLIAQLFKENK
jgi:hypothetical protein